MKFLYETRYQLSKYWIQANGVNREEIRREGCGIGGAVIIADHHINRA